ncbi:hypothetical protein AG1IA_09392 [Rhizoctonia solani AG-1 IA]|uniref:Uncharacterized protein n=1 Tax=Thanatephorus cucumeris (strain AG1-IA) TaxID=983506 RepID=L8WIL0_THACA|nr:hypothetical protein AG1IA_09392 [Rhizoctonia solani AG-1 IA]
MRGECRPYLQEPRTPAATCHFVPTRLPRSLAHQQSRYEVLHGLKMKRSLSMDRMSPDLVPSILESSSPANLRRCMHRQVSMPPRQPNFDGLALACIQKLHLSPSTLEPFDQPSQIRYECRRVRTQLTKPSSYVR